MKKKAYTAKTISGAQSYVRSLLKQRDKTHRLLDRYHQERKTLAMLAADGACFSNPIVVAAAKQLRDEILKNSCGLNPDGTYRGLPSVG